MPARRRAVLDGGTLFDLGDFLGLGGRFRITNEITYTKFGSENFYVLTSELSVPVFLHLSYVVNPGVSKVDMSRSTSVQAHVSSGAYGQNNLWQYVYDVRFPGRSQADIANGTFYVFRLIPTYATKLVSARISWSLNSATEDSFLASYPTPKLYDEEALVPPYLNSSRPVRDDEVVESADAVEMAPSLAQALPNGQYRLVCDVGDGFVYTMYHELLAQYKSTAPMVLWNLSRLAGVEGSVLLQQDTVNGSGWLAFVGGPSWSDKPYTVVLRWKGNGWALGDGTRFIGGYTTGSGPPYAESVATYQPSFTTFENALTFSFTRSLQDVS